MAIVSLQNAQAELGELLIRAEAGEEIVIERGDELPALRLIVTRPAQQHVLPQSELPSRTEMSSPDLGYGSFSHLRGRIPDSFFFDPLPEDEMKLWEGGD